jgi:hypothetical protein
MRLDRIAEVEPVVRTSGCNLLVGCPANDAGPDRHRRPLPQCLKRANLSFGCVRYFSLRVFAITLVCVSVEIVPRIIGVVAVVGVMLV